jgi:hypothetical protein
MTTIASFKGVSEPEPCCAEDYGGSHYHCAHCGKVSSMYGHYGDPKAYHAPICANTKPGQMRTEDGRTITIGFCCPVGHTCKLPAHTTESEAYK